MFHLQEGRRILENPVLTSADAVLEAQCALAFEAWHVFGVRSDLPAWNVQCFVPVRGIWNILVVSED